MHKFYNIALYQYFKIIPILVNCMCAVLSNILQRKAACNKMKFSQQNNVPIILPRAKGAVYENFIS